MLHSIDCGYSLELPQRDGPSEHHNICFEQIMRKNITIFHLKFSVFTAVNEPRREKTGFLHMLISAFVSATQIVQSLYFLNTKFQASSHLMRLYSPVSVGHGRKPRRLVFSQRGSNYTGEPELRVVQ